MQRTWIWLPLLTAALLAPAAAATAAEAPTGNKPVEITADEQFEYHEDRNAVVARGNVVAVQGDLTLHTDTLTALYRKDANGATEIYRLMAEGKVVLASPSQKAFGDHGVYDIDKSVAVLTGDALRMETKEDTVTARDTLEYWREQNLLVARGNALAVRGDKRIQADQMVGLLQESADNQLNLTRIDAKGNVVITTPSEVARGTQGVYDIDRKLATLTGNVRVTRGTSQLNGSIAEVNMDSGVSRMLAGPGARRDGRVHGVFTPSEKSSGSKPGAGGAGTPGSDKNGKTP